VSEKKKQYPAEKIKSHSFDKGFWSRDNLATPQQADMEQVVLPKRGRHNKEDKERQGESWFKKLRNAHSAVESNINMLEHHGLYRCMDKGLHRFKRYAGFKYFSLQPTHTWKCTNYESESRRGKKAKTATEDGCIDIENQLSEKVTGIHIRKIKESQQ